MSDPNKIIIFDTTLRDGEQSPGFSMNLKEKMEFAHQLKRLGVDVIEAGFPITSVGDYESVKAIAEEVEGPQICGLARAVEKDIDRCWEAVQYSKTPRIHTFIATSNVHVERKLRKTPAQVLEMAVKAVQHAKQYTENVEFSTEDAARTDRDYICDVIQAAIEAGATTINVPDTVGYSNPWEFGSLIEHIFKTVPNVNNAVISVHCHNDMGLAVANSLAAVKQGARQVECTINGIGERAGNTSLEEFVMNLVVRKEQFGVSTGIVTEQIYPSSRLLTQFTGIHVQPNKAIVGANAFAHEAGIHQDGMLKDRETYEIMTPDSVGWMGESMVLGKHSGRHALAERLSELGFTLNGEAVGVVYDKFKELADRKKAVYDSDLIALVDQHTRDKEVTRYKLLGMKISTSADEQAQANIKIDDNGTVKEDTGTGDGALDAAFSVIKTLTETEDCRLTDFRVDAVSTGTDAQGSAHVALQREGAKGFGRGTDTDVIRASVKAFLNAVNHLVSSEPKEKTDTV